MKHGVIIAALPAELRPLVHGWRYVRHDNADLWQRPAVANAAWKWTAACAGIGAPAALRALAAAEAAGGPADYLISAGFAGALTDACVPGRVYCPETVLKPTAARSNRDIEAAAVTDLGGGTAYYRGSGVPAASGAGDAVDVSAASRGPEAAGLPARRSQAKEGRFHVNLVTADRVMSAGEKSALAGRFQAQLVDMEAAAVAEIALKRGGRFACVKGVSDGPRDRLPNHPSLISEDGRLRYGRLILYAASRPSLWPSLLRVGQNSARAARGLKTALLAIMDDAS